MSVELCLEAPRDDYFINNYIVDPRGDRTFKNMPLSSKLTDFNVEILLIPPEGE